MSPYFEDVLPQKGEDPNHSQVWPYNVHFESAPTAKSAVLVNNENRIVVDVWFLN